MIALDLRRLNFICLRTPLCCRSRVPRDRCHRCQVRPGGSESDRCVQSSMLTVPVRLPGTLCRAPAFFQLETVPGVRFPGEVNTLGAFDFRLPRLEHQLLSVAVKTQNIALRNDTGITLLSSLLRCGHVGFNGVVGPV